jgi:hypothetical protein
LRTSPNFGAGGWMEINEQKVDEMSLALLYLTTFRDKFEFRAWKSHS